MRPSSHRTLLAVAIAPWTVIPAAVVGALVRGWRFEVRELPFFAIYLPFSYVTAIVGGLPLHVFFRRHGYTKYATYAIAGALLATGASLISGVWPLPYEHLLFGAAGLAAGIAFRAVRGPGSEPSARRRPRGEPNPPMQPPGSARG